MKVVFVEPPANFIPVRHGVYFPNNGVLSLAAYLESFRFDVSIIDSYVNRFNYKDVLKEISKLKPNIVAISNSFTFKTYYCMAMAKLIKEYFPEIIIIAGGIHFSAVPEESLRICESIDYIIMGEGEKTILELVQKLSNRENKNDFSGVRGLAYILDGKFIKTIPRPLIEDIDSLPIPAYHLLPLKAKRIPFSWQNSIGCTFSRGCFYKCKFCSSTTHWRYTLRRRGLDKMFEELELLNRCYGKNSFVFGDDDFLYDKERNSNFLNEIEKRKLKIKYSVRTRVDEIIENRQLLKKFRDTGLISVSLGIERFSDNNMKLLSKSYDRNCVGEALEMIKRVKIPITEIYLIFGLPNDNRSVWMNMIREINNMKQFVFFVSYLTPLPGTVLSKELFSKINVWDYRKYDFMHPIIANNYSSLDEMKKYIWKTSFFWWFNPKILLWSIQNLYNFKFYLFRLLMHFRAVNNFFKFLIKSIFFKKINAYSSNIELIYKRHTKYIGQSHHIQVNKRGGLLGTSWGFMK